ncbi:MBL fold metallo-hydrolase [Caldimonas sp. KR1-144]|uniref:MBL fold metallo-hydrolase n=1 Tax=Caldimonas sp. KR1-144 TaxID=3400911 RepID=UPI003C0BB542
MHDFIEPLSHGIHAIDTGFVRARFDAAYLIVEQGRAAFVDAGLNDSVPRLLAALDALGLARDAVDWVIPTHVHLDHAGGAGLLMAQLPAAKMAVHPRGARHMIDPSALLDGARGVYGADEVARTYGDVRPVPAERVVATTDGMTIELAGRPLQFIDSPGHARHHHCIWDAASRGWFTGDTFGLSYPEFEAPKGRYLLPTTTPVQFEPEALKQSVARMLEREPVWMYPTHYGRIGGSVEEVRRLAALLLEQTGAMVALARPLAGAPARHEALKSALGALYAQRLRALGSALDDAEIAGLLAMDVELNAQGLGVWLDREARSAA